MANDEVVCLMEVVEELVIILHRILNMKIFQAEKFIEKVGEVIIVLEMEGTPTLPDQLMEDIALLALPRGDFVQRIGPLTPPSFDEYEMNFRHRRGRKLSRVVPELVEQIGLNEHKLEKFLNESDFYDSWEDLRHNLALQPSREAVRDLLHSCRELKDTMNFFHEVVTESAFLCRHLKFLLSFAELCERSNERRCRQFVKGIMDVARKALAELECGDKLKLSWMSNPAPRALPFFMAEEFLDGKNGKRLVILETLGMLHSFTEEIDTTRRKLGTREDPQSHNASFGRNGFPAVAMIREKFAREDLPSLPIKYYLRAFPLVEARKTRRANRGLLGEQTLVVWDDQVLGLLLYGMIKF